MGPWLFGLALLVGCAHGAFPRVEAGGALLLVVERGDATELRIVERGGAARVPGVAPREARWIDPERILVVDTLPPAEEFGLPRTRLLVIDRAGRTLAVLGEPGRHHDAEPSADGAWLAVGVETPGGPSGGPAVGDSDLAIHRLSPPWERVAVRHQSLEEPRWRHDGRALVAALLRADPETDDDTGGGMLGTAFTWPRLHTLRRDLGDPILVWDGPTSDALAPGGTLPLWWGADGVFARQRHGLVRCDPVAGGCARIFAPEADRRIVDGRPLGETQAWLLAMPASDAFDRRLPDEVLRVDRREGRLLSRWRAPDGLGIVDLDWIGRPTPRSDRVVAPETAR